MLNAIIQLDVPNAIQDLFLLMMIIKLAMINQKYHYQIIIQIMKLCIIHVILLNIKMMPDAFH